MCVIACVTENCTEVDDFADVVFWNPGPGHSLADVPEDGASHFVCIEAVALHPIVLGAGQTWSGTQILTIQG